MEKRLYRSRTERMIWGVAGGLARYFGIDPVIIRLIFILLIFAGGLGIIAYIILAIVVPLEGSQATEPRDTIRENVEEIKGTATQFGQEVRSTFTRERTEEEVREHQRRRNLLGIILIIIGIIFLIVTFNVFWWFEWSRLWPLILIAVGILLLISFRRK